MLEAAMLLITVDWRHLCAGFGHALLEEAHRRRLRENRQASPHPAQSTIGHHAASFLYVREVRLHVHASSEDWTLMCDLCLQPCRLAADQGDNPVALQEALIEIEKDQVHMSLSHA
jgi:hypothetical protein